MEYKTISRKDAILEIARHILIQEGHYRLTMRHLAEKSGMKLASLQYHYPTKTELISALMAQSIGTYHQMIRQLVRSIKTTETGEDNVAIGRLFAVYQDEQMNGVFDQLWALSVQDPSLKKQYEKAYADFWEVIGQEVGRFDPSADEATKRTRATMIIALLDGLETFFSADELRANIPNQLQDHVVTLVRNIATGK